jgi:hypothetical protein
MALQFIASPVSMVLHTVNRQSWAMLLQISGFVIRAGVVLVIVAIDTSFLVPAFAMSSALFYLIYIGAVIHAARVRSA